MYLTKRQHESLDVIDFPVSSSFAAYYRESGYYVPGYMVRQPDQRLSADVSPETAQLLARVIERQEDQSRDIVKLKDHLGRKALQTRRVTDNDKTPMNEALDL